jgi:hypothetical protein
LTAEAPGNLERLRPYLPKNIAQLRYRINELSKRLLYRSDWALQLKPGEDLCTSFKDSWWIIPPLYTWWADPHLAYENGSHYVFVEEKSRAKPWGHISVIKVDKEGNWTGPERVLEKPYHLSYPFVFRHGDKYYMVPESASNRSIDLYEAEEFPLKWRLKKTIMSNVMAYDSTLVHRDGLWWLFCTMVADQRLDSANDRLHLFYSDDLLSEHWEAHPMNPIVTDSSCARPAGALFEKDGNLFRPSQGCATCYGFGISINRIEELNKDSFKEAKVNCIQPNWDKRVSRVHTINHVHGLTVIDAYLERVRWQFSK